MALHDRRRHADHSVEHAGCVGLDHGPVGDRAAVSDRGALAGITQAIPSDERAICDQHPLVENDPLVDDTPFDRAGRDPSVEDHFGRRRGDDGKRRRRAERTVVDDDGTGPAGERHPGAARRRESRAPGQGARMTVVPPARHGGVDRDPEREHAHEQAMEESSQGTPRSCGGGNRRSGAETVAPRPGVPRPCAARLWGRVDRRSRKRSPAPLPGRPTRPRMLPAGSGRSQTLSCPPCNPLWEA